MTKSEFATQPLTGAKPFDPSIDVSGGGNIYKPAAMIRNSIKDTENSMNDTDQKMTKVETQEL